MSSSLAGHPYPPFGARPPHHPPAPKHTSIFDAADEAIPADGAFPAFRRPSLSHAPSWAGPDSTPKQQDGYFAAFGPPNPLTLDPYLAAAPAPPPGLGPPFQPSPSPSTFPFPSAAPGRAPPTRMASDASAYRTLDGSMAALALDSGSGGGANDGSPGGSSGGSSSAFTFDGRSSPASKDAALELLSRKVIQMEAKLNSQSSLMLRLRDENLTLKDRCRRENLLGLGGGGGGGGGSNGGGGAEAELMLAMRDCRTEPGTPVDTAVKCALGVLGDADFGPFTPSSQPHPEVVARILSQSFSYSLVLPQDFRALTWTLAHRTQRSAQEGHALKFAANFLISKVQQLRGQPMEAVVHDAILTEVVGLSQTANGNYLVQQLLECGGPRARGGVYDLVRAQLLTLAGDKYGTHVVCKTAEYSELRALLVQDLVEIGVSETFQTGARRLWKSIFDHCKKAGETGIFNLVLEQMRGRWTECATTTENGTISVQQVFESWPSMAFMEPVLVEIIQNIARIANGGWGHFLISKLLSNPTGNLRPTILMALLESPAPVAVGHHGISFLRTALLELGRPGVEMYVDTLCSARREGQSPHIVEVAGAVVGPGHISFLWTMLSSADKTRLKDACRNHIVSIRSSQSGNDLLRQLGLMPSNTIPKLR